MRKVIAGAVAGGLLMLAAPAANALCVVCDDTGCHVSTGSCGPGATSRGPQTAHGRSGGGVGYTGGCGIDVANDMSDGGVLGGQRVWNGEVDILVAASTPGSLITAADCYVKVTASGGETKTLSAVPGAPVAAAAGQVTFTADVTDTVYICTHVATTAPTAETDDCAALTTTPICPVQVCGPGGWLDQVNVFIDAVNEQTKVLDPAICSVLITLAPSVDGLPTSGVVYIDPATGDTWVGGISSPSVFYDCPPYQATT